MISLAFGATVLDEHTRLACLETNAPLLAAIGTVANCRHAKREVKGPEIGREPQWEVGLG